MAAAEQVLKVASFAGRVWLYCLKRAVWVALLSAMASMLQLSFSQSGDMEFSGDMEDENETNGSAIFPPCPVNMSCEQLPGRCIMCDFNESCVYGDMTEVTCMAREGVNCSNVSLCAGLCGHRSLI